MIFQDTLILLSCHHKEYTEIILSFRLVFTFRPITVKS